MMRRMTMTHSLVLWMALAGLVATSACGDDAAPAQSSFTNNAPGNNTPIPPNNNPRTARLEHVSNQTVGVAANSRVTLEVRYVDPSGAPLSDQTLGWEIIGMSEGSVIDARQSNTNASGVATIQVNSAAREAQFEVEVTATNDVAVAPIRFTVNVESKEFASYRVLVNYNGVRRYTNNNIKVSLYEMPDDCADFNPLRPGTAFRSEKRRPDAMGFPMNFTFTNLPNGSRYTAVAVAFAAESDTVEVIGSYGCNAERPEIVDGNNPDPVVVEMTDLLPEIGGTWAVTSRFDLTEALPENVLNILNPILDFFTDPEGTLISLLSEFIQEQFGLDIGAIQGLLEGIAEDLLGALIDNNETVRDVLTAGGDISEILRNFNLEGSIIIPEDSIAENGLITDARIVYTNFGYRWRLNCESDQEYEENPACGDAFIPFGDAGLTPIEANWNGAISPNANFDPNTGRIWFHELTVNDHRLDLNYGQIIGYLIEKVALPLLFDPTIDSLNALLGQFVDCADIFSDNSTFETVCETAIEQVSIILRDQLNSLSINSDNFTIGTPPESACALYEQEDDDYGAPEPPNLSHEPRFQEMGKDLIHPDHGDLRCLWRGQIQFGSDPSDLTVFTGRFSGEKRFDN